MENSACHERCLKEKKDSMTELRAVRRMLLCGLCLCFVAPLVALPARAQSQKKSREEITIERLEAIHEIENLMSEYYWMHASDQMKDYLMAYHTPGARVTNDLHEQSMVQTEKNTSAKQGLDRDARRIEMRSSPGFLHVHLEASPVIELAADGNSARGSWISPGLEADPPGMKPAPAGQRTTVGYWAWAKLGAEFVKENGQWRIWHLHVYSLFMTPYDQSWAEADPNSEGGGPPASSGPPGGSRGQGSGGAAGAGAPGGSGGPPGSGGSPGAGGPQQEEEAPLDKSTLPISEKWLYTPTAVYPDAKPLPPAPYDTYQFDRSTSY
jgi:uncharacterized membrane protein YgcG